MAGGVALNCVINGKILEQSGFKRLWVQPAAGDAGGALGAAYADSYEQLGKERYDMKEAHVDYIARIQTVNCENHPDFYDLIRAFYELTGCPCLINTSFNRMDEPIVNTPQDAIDCFMQTGMDILLIETFIVVK